LPIAFEANSSIFDRNWKSSLSLALAGGFRLELFLLHLLSVRDDKSLQELFMQLPPKCFVLLEDIDAVVINSRSGMDNNLQDDDKDDDKDDDEDDEEEANSPEERESSCTLYGLLNVLDGVAAGEGRIVLMASNSAHMLYKALVQPGRVDKMIFLGNISQRSVELMFLRMYSPNLAHTTTVADEKHRLRDGELQKLALEFSNQIPELMLTTALLQGYLLHHRNSPAAAVAGTSA
jgi:mitochondrial chaperone BCS1